MFLIVPIQYGVAAPVGVEGVAASPAGRGIRTNDKWRGACSHGLFACWTGVHTSMSHSGGDCRGLSGGRGVLATMAF